ncbi:MAG: ABC transporter permease [Candidatus Omnitrophota bacterium]|nr:ABC transporter permease [Candidatus Omnitrophota bacterium]
MKPDISLRKLLAFLKRDLLINASYRAAFLFDLISILSSVVTFFFIAKLFGGKAAEHLADYGGDYFSFVLIGIAFSGYMSAAMGSFTEAISEEQAYGTLEAIVLSPTKISTVLICSSIWKFIFTSFRVIVYLFLGWLFFDLNLSRANLSSSLIILALTIISFSALGILSASFTLIFKRGDPLNWLFYGASRLLGGVYFPIAVLPIGLQKISFFLPLTYCLEAVRKSLILGSSVKEILPQILSLVFFSALFFPLSIFSFKSALKKAQKNGSLLYS